MPVCLQPYSILLLSRAVELCDKWYLIIFKDLKESFLLRGARLLRFIDAVKVGLEIVLNTVDSSHVILRRNNSMDLQLSNTLVSAA